MQPEQKCVIDWSRSCRSCSAPSPCECPYGYLLDPEDFAEIAERGHALGIYRDEEERSWRR